MMTNSLSPIVLFTFNRPYHTLKTLEALKANTLASKSDLFVYCDGPRNDQDIQAVTEVRDLVRNLTGFKSITVVESPENKGLAQSIISGVTEVIEKYGTVIVLEDDIVTSPYFLGFMNLTLRFFEKEEGVWHVCGWSYPVSSEGIGDIYCMRLLECWGWGTWASRWKYNEKNPEKLRSSFSKEDIFRFNLDGVHNVWGQVEANISGKINTWAVFWYATIFKNNGLCLYPSQSLVQNIGFDDTGVHCGCDSSLMAEYSSKKDFSLKVCILENDIAVERIKKFHKDKKKNILTRIINKVWRSVLGKNLIE